MQLNTILSINQIIQQSKTFGGLYKITKYSQPVINLLNSLNLQTLIDLVNQNSTSSIYDVSDIDLQNKLFELAELINIDNLIYENEIIPSNYLTDFYEAVFINEVYHINFKNISVNDLPKLVIGQFFNIFSFKDKSYLGKGMLKTLIRSNKLGTLKLNLDITDALIYVQIDNWWQYSSNSTKWLNESNSILLSSPDNRATMKVQYETSIKRLGRIKWIFYYKENLNVDYIPIAEGVDSLLPGLLIISKQHYLFPKGYFKLNIIDKSISVTIPTKKYLEWYKGYSSSELLSEGLEFKNG